MQANSPMSRGPADAPPPLPSSAPPHPATTLASHTLDQPQRATLSQCKLGSLNSVTLVAMLAAIVIIALRSTPDQGSPLVSTAGHIVGGLVAFLVLALLASLVGVAAFYAFSRSQRAFQLSHGVVTGLVTLVLFLGIAARSEPQKAAAISELEQLAQRSVEQQQTDFLEGSSTLNVENNLKQLRTIAEKAGGPEELFLNAMSDIGQRMLERHTAQELAGNAYASSGGLALTDVESPDELRTTILLLERGRTATVAVKSAFDAIPSDIRAAMRTAAVPAHEQGALLGQMLAEMRHQQKTHAVAVQIDAVNAQHAYLQYALEHFDHWGIDQSGRTVWTTPAHADAFNDLIEEVETTVNNSIRSDADAVNVKPREDQFFTLTRSISIVQPPKP